MPPDRKNLLPTYRHRTKNRLLPQMMGRSLLHRPEPAQSRWLCLRRHRQNSLQLSALKKNRKLRSRQIRNRQLLPLLRKSRLLLYRQIRNNP